METETPERHARVVKKLHNCPLDFLRENPENPRTITPARFEALCASIESDPTMLEARPVVALEDGLILAGNMRRRACAALGRRTVPTVLVDVDPVTARAWMLRDNNEYGTWDDFMLATQLQTLRDADFDMGLLGFDVEELDRIMRAGQPPEPPASFPPVDPNEQTDYRCPSCGFEWNGQARPGGDPS